VLKTTVSSTGSNACGERRLQGPAVLGQAASAAQRSKKKTSDLALVRFE